MSHKKAKVGVRNRQGHSKKTKTVRYQEVDRSDHAIPHPVFDDDEDVERFLNSLFGTMAQWWDKDYIEADGSLVIPPPNEFGAMLRDGEPDNDIHTILTFYLDNFFPHVPEDPELARLVADRDRDTNPTLEDHIYIATYILREHQDGD